MEPFFNSFLLVSASDIDLMIVGALGLRETANILSKVVRATGREINPYVLTLKEFQNRRSKKDHFITQVLSRDKFFIIGSEGKLKTMD